MTIEANKLDEFKSSFGVDAHVPDPTGTGDKKRAADNKAPGEKAPAAPTTKAAILSSLINTIASMPKAELSKMHADVANQATLAPGSKFKAPMVASSSIKEDLEEIFGDEKELTEGFVEKAATLFESAVNIKVVEYKAQLDEAFETQLDEAVLKVTEEVGTAVASYLDYVVEQWIEENRLAIEAGVKSEISESFMSGLKNLFSEHYIDIPEDKVDVVETLTARVNEVEAQLNEEINKNIEVSAKAEALETAAAFTEIAEGLTLAQTEKLRELSESVEFDNVEEFKKKVAILKDSVLGTVAKPIVESAEAKLNESVESLEEEKKPKIDDRMSRYVSQLSKYAKESK